MLENQDKSDEEIRELIQESRIEYMTTSKYRELKMELEVETEDDWGEHGGDE